MIIEAGRNGLTISKILNIKETVFRGVNGKYKSPFQARGN